VARAELDQAPRVLDRYQRLVGDHGHGRARCQPGHAFEIVGRARLLAALEAEGLEVAEARERGLRVPGAVGVDPEVGLVPERIAHRAEHLEIRRALTANLDLHAGHAELPDRLTGLRRLGRAGSRDHGAVLDARRADGTERLAGRASEHLAAEVEPRHLERAEGGVLGARESVGLARELCGELLERREAVPEQSLDAT
jgi:hypothetical protein